jgi:hypothetical protein
MFFAAGQGEEKQWPYQQEAVYWSLKIKVDSVVESLHSLYILVGVSRMGKQFWLGDQVLVGSCSILKMTCCSLHCTLYMKLKSWMHHAMSTEELRSSAKKNELIVPYVLAGWIYCLLHDDFVQLVAANCE